MKQLYEGRPLLQLAAIMGSLPPLQEAMDTMGITAHPQGVRGGWFGFPLNYDPVWMQGECKHFEQKERQL
jgi:hypothetical protein